MIARRSEGLSVVVVGEALVDVVTTTGAAGAADTVTHPGGSPMNVAFGLARLGLPTVLHTRIGRDAHGAAIVRHLAEAGVRLGDAALVDAPTATATAVLDEAGHAEYAFDIVWELPPPDVPAGTTLLHTGSIAAVLQPGADEVLRVVTRERERTLVSFDPNVRPSITPDRAAVRARVDALATLAHVVKLSDEDAAWLYPDDSLDTVMDRLLGGGSRLVAVTRGAEGCLLATASARLRLPAPPVAVVDTIGAGDAFMSGLLAAILDRGLTDDLRAGDLAADELAALGLVALRSAGITVARAGAAPPTAVELGL